MEAGNLTTGLQVKREKLVSGMNEDIGDGGCGVQAQAHDSYGSPAWGPFLGGGGLGMTQSDLVIWTGIHTMLGK